MARALVVVGVVACLVFGWHLYGVADARRQAEELRTKHVPGQSEPVTVNPVTDIVTMPIDAVPEKSKTDNPFEALGNAIGSMLGGALAKSLEPVFERELNIHARESYDLYAILLPYRVRIVAPPAPAKPT
jgi:hypothetical protein